MKQPDLTETATGDDGMLDRISNLPESLLVQIISLLPTTEEACRTSLVSKRWQYLWTCIDTLNLVCTNYESGGARFVSFVDYVFAKRNCLKIRKFDLEFLYMPRYSMHIDQWLSYVVKNKVEHVLLNTAYFRWYTLPQLFYTFSSLITLHLTNCVLIKGVDIFWKSLKDLKFKKVDIDDKTIVKLLSGCPALETTELSLFSGFHRLEINNSTLRTLKLSSAWQGSDHSFFTMKECDRSLDIIAPYLHHLEISGCIGDFKCRLLNVSSLVSADLTFHPLSKRCEKGILSDSAYVEYYRCRNYHHDFWSLAQDYLQKLSNVTKLTIGTWLSEVILMLQLDGVQLPELKSKCLMLKLCISKYNFYGVASLLQASPHVETLNIDVDDDDIDIFRFCLYELSYFQKGYNIDLESWLSNIAFPSLKCVNITCSIGMCHKERHVNLYELSEFLLKNAMVLEKFFIIAKERRCRQCSKNCVSPYLSQLAAKLLGCVRPSTKFMMISHDSY